MEQFKMQAAGRVVAVSALFSATREFCADYLCDGEPDFSVTITPQDIVFEQKKVDQENEMEGLPPHVFEDHMLERTALQRKIAEKLFERDTLLFHGSVIAVGDEAFLFTAKSGTGKSTHVSYWRVVFGKDAKTINDDKPFLRVTPEGVRVYGSPWNGKHGLGCNTDAPLKAICVLERGDDNVIQRISAAEVVPMLLQQSNRPMQPKYLPQYMQLLDQISGKVAFYRLACNMSPQAAVVAYEAMSGKKIGEMKDE